MSARIHGATVFPLATPSATPLTAPPAGLYIVADGDLQVTDQADNSATFAVVAGQVIPIQPTIIGTATTATVMLLNNNPT